MTVYSLGPRAQRVYEALHDRILRGELAPGEKLPPHTELAVDFGVAPLTVRQVLARLEEEGLVSREQGRGTFVRAPAVPAVLIAEDDEQMRALLAAQVTRGGYHAISVAGPVEGLQALEQDRSIALVFSDIRMPDAASGVEFIRTVRRRWPELPVVAVTGFPEDLAGLHGTPESPVLVLPKPVWAHQVEETLRLTLRP